MPPSRWSWATIYDRSFLTRRGFDLHSGIANTSLPGVEVKAAALAKSKYSGLDAEASKWGQNTFDRVAPLTGVQAVITDERLPSEAHTALSSLGLDVRVVRS